MLSKSNKFMNSSGCWCSTKEQLDNLFNTRLNNIITKTCTLYPRKGNEEPTYFKIDDIHINSKGLPNEGYYYYKNLYKEYNLENKKFILSIAWEQNENNTIELLNDYDNSVSKNELVELNLSCPNMKYEIPCYNPIILEKILKKINSLNLKNIYFSLKLSPYLDHSLCDIIINIINNNNNNKIIKYIVLSNSIPNCLILNENKPVLSNIYGGLSGKLNKYISLSNVYYFKNKLNNDIEIIGCGGIETLEDVNNYLNNGASYVQLGSCFYNNILNELDYEKINSIIDEYEK